jgi:circadian clock protein KaiC
VRHGERVLYVTLSETAEELHTVAASHGFDLKGVDLFELSSAETVLGAAQEQSILHPWEIELGGTVDLIKEQVEKIAPARVVFDSLSELRLLAQDSLRYRRQVLALKQFFAGRKTTVVVVDDLTGEGRDAHLHSICHGVLTLERTTLQFGPARRRLEMQKLRGVDFIAGYHDLAIRKGGLEVYPRLLASDHHAAFVDDPTPSGVNALDALLAGGPLRGTTTLLAGPAGAGKTTIALQYVVAACERGENATIFEFDERIGTMLTRSKSMGLNLQKHMDSGRLRLFQVDPAAMSPGEFAWKIRLDVQDRNCKVTVVDSLDGYLAAMPQEEELLLQMHELLSYLNQKGVVTFLVNLQAGLVGSTSLLSLNISYIADAVILLRFFEDRGRVRKAISVIKNRGGPHEDTIRELRIDGHGVRIGEPLVEFEGIMTGTPRYVGSRNLMEDRGT